MDSSKALALGVGAGSLIFIGGVLYYLSNKRLFPVDEIDEIDEIDETSINSNEFPHQIIQQIWADMTPVQRLPYINGDNEDNEDMARFINQMEEFINNNPNIFVVGRRLHGPQRPPLTSQYPPYPYASPMKLPYPDCPICLARFEFGESLIRLHPTDKTDITKQHIFHQSCIERWASTNTTCPLCRKRFFGRRKRRSKSKSKRKSRRKSRRKSKRRSKR
jgi:hypothetical protein